MTGTVDLERRLRAADELLDDYAILIAEAHANARWFAEAAELVQARLDREAGADSGALPLAVELRRRFPERELGEADDAEFEASAFALLRHYIAQRGYAEQQLATLQQHRRDVDRRLRRFERETAEGARRA